jgi:hypothetical protein
VLAHVPAAAAATGVADGVGVADLDGDTDGDFVVVDPADGAFVLQPPMSAAAPARNTASSRRFRLEASMGNSRQRDLDKRGSPRGSRPDFYTDCVRNKDELSGI